MGNNIRQTERETIQYRVGNNIKQTESERIQDRQRAKQYKTPQRDGKGDKRQRLWIGWLVDWGNTTDGKRWRTDT